MISFPEIYYIKSFAASWLRAFPMLPNVYIVFSQRSHEV